MFNDGSNNGIIGNDTKIISLLKVIIEACSGERMITNFIKKTNEHWEKIKNRDIEYFKTNGMSLFTSIKEEGLENSIDDELKSDNVFLKNLKFDHLNNFKLLLESSYTKNGEEVDIFNDERKEDIWKILESLVKISIVYIHQERGYVNGEYSREYFPDIQIKENVKKWNIRSIRF